MSNKKSNLSVKGSFLWFERPKMQFGVLLLLAVLIYAQTLSFEFTNWDDQEYIANNKLVTQFSLASLPEIFSSFVMGNYHPLTILSFGIEYTLVKNSAALMHFTNVLLHISNSILLLILLKKINKNWLFCFLPAVLFLVHPLHVESVAWISERKDVLYVFFFFLSAITYFKYKISTQNKFYFISILLFICSLLSKGQAVVLPLFLICLELINGDEFNFKKLVFNKIPYFIFALVFGIVAVKAQASVDVIANVNTFSFTQQIVIALNGLWFYIQSTFIPYKLATYYIYPEKLSLMFYIKACLAIVICISVFIYFKKTKPVFWSFVLFVVTIFPVLQFLPVGTAMYADRYYYLPSIGLFIMISLFLMNLLTSNKNRIVFFVSIFVLFLSVYSYSQVKVWKNSYTLWEQVRNNYPNTPSAWYNTGNYFMKAANPDYSAALPYFVKATQLKNNYPKAYNNLGVSYYNLNDFKNALSAYKQAYSLDASDADLALNVGKAYDMLAQYDSSVYWFTIALKKQPNNDLYLYNMGISQFKKGNIDESISYYKKAIALNANNAEYYNNYGTSLIYKKEYNQALEMYQKANLINANYAEAYFNKALTYQVLGDTLKMIDNLKIAANLGHIQAKQYFNLK